MARLAVACADGYGLGLAKWSVVDGRLMWGHTGDGVGSHSELWYLPEEHVTVAVTWNDDAVNFDGQFLRRSSAPQSAASRAAPRTATECRGRRRRRRR